MVLGDADTKRRLRQAMGERRRGVPAEISLAASRSVAAIVSAHPRVRAARWVGLYASAGGELPTRAIFDELAPVATLRCFPRVRGRSLEWVPVDRFDQLVPGSFGIPEPPGPAVAGPGPGGVVLLPGLAFDAHGWRLGRGGGYYDRAFPADRPAPCLVGVGYAFQRIDSVPHGSRDRRVDAIVSEEGWMWRVEDR